MQTTEEKEITLPLHNWEAIKRLEWEKDCLSRGSATFWFAVFATGVFFSPLWVLMGLVYKPMIRVTKLARIVKVMRPLLEEFEEQGIQIFPCLKVPEHEPLDFYIRFPEAQLLVSIRSMKDAEVVYNEKTEHLYSRKNKKKGGLRKWLPCPLVELSDYQAWLYKNRQLFGLTSKQVQKFPLAKVLVLWNTTTIQEHRKELYTSIGSLELLALKRKGTAFVIQEDNIVHFVKAYLEQYKQKN
ncbi:MAG: hypothetical protein WBB28_11845 [Crinalium sp.]